MLFINLFIYIFTLLQLVWKYFYSSKSSNDHGTIYQLKNLINRTNVVTKPLKSFDACEDFLCAPC